MTARRRWSRPIVVRWDGSLWTVWVHGVAARGCDGWREAMDYAEREAAWERAQLAY